jgi:hypothetical protein
MACTHLSCPECGDDTFPATDYDRQRALPTWTDGDECRCPCGALLMAVEGGELEDGEVYMIARTVGEGGA